MSLLAAAGLAAGALVAVPPISSNATVAAMTALWGVLLLPRR